MHRSERMTGTDGVDRTGYGFGDQRCSSSERTLATLPAAIQKHGPAMHSGKHMADVVFNVNTER